MSHRSSQSKKHKFPDKKHVTAKPAAKPGILNFSLEQKPWIYVILMFLIVSILYFPVAFQQKSPPAVDISQWKGAAQRVIEYNKTHEDRALWQPNMFSGMPSYLISFPMRYPFVENVTKAVDYVMNWRIFLLFIGGLGVFLLLRFLKLDGFTSFLGAIAFIFSCHWVGLLEIGHNTKFRTIMWVPWVVWAIMYLRKHPGVLGLGMASVFMITQLREKHPQISYYLYLFIGMFWIYSLIETFGKKDWGKFVTFSALLVAAFVLMGLAVMNPFLSIWEYGHYSIRGGEGGLDKAYAQGWSFHPLETLTFIIPDFFGGIHDGVSNNYWGWMEFTQIYNYCGILVLALAFFAFAGKNKKLAWFLWISSGIFLIMSFGKHWNFVSDLLLNYLPYFNRFRVPSMILTILKFSVAILSALGLAAIIDKAKNKDEKFNKKVKSWLIIAAIVFVLFLVLGKSVFSGLPFVSQSQLAEYRQQNAMDQLPALRELRLGLLHKSGILSLLFLTLGLCFIYLFLQKKMQKSLFLILILLIVFIDLWIYTGRKLRNVRKPDYKENYFSKKDYDEFLLADTDNYRIYPLNVGLAGNWAYYHQTIQGYHGAKLRRYQDVLENCLDKQLRQQQINWNLLNMLNTKYVIFSDSLPFFNLRPVFSSNYDRVIVHRNLSALPRAWFVDSLTVMTEPSGIWEKINSETFSPGRTAIVEETIKGVEAPTVKNVTPTKFDLHYLSFDVETDKPAFLTVSEVYYPAGWRAFIDGKETKIYPTNYILRGVVVPAGKHKLEMKFEPQSYRLSIRLSLIGILLSSAALVLGLFLWFRNNRKGKLLKKEI